MDGMRLLGSLLVSGVVSFVIAATVHADPVRLEVAPSVDVSVSHACAWAWDWEGACAWFLGDALPVGGDYARVWRAALVFDLDSVPRGAAIDTAELRLWFTGSCITASGTRGACDGRAWTLESDPILTSDWASERELGLADAVDVATIPPLSGPRWISFDVTSPVASWLDGDENDGVAVRLGDAQEVRRGSGPRFASTRAADAAARPRLVVTYEGGGASG